jgi:NAD(P)-dependent dehydrogenase (short-subunit alcohol dehydrogenase family)
MGIDLTGRVAIVTGAGGGLGRAHALLLGKHGAKVVVNDLGGGTNGASSPAEKVAAEIVAAGGVAMVSNGSVANREDVQVMVASTMEQWGRIDILVNNAGILRDKSFAKMDLDDFRLVIDVHLMGSVYCTKAVWDIMRVQNYGRIVMTTSSSGLFGNFGQTNYSAAKMALVGVMQTLAIEGFKYNVRVNCIAPTAATKMMEGLLAPQLVSALAPEYVSPGVLALVADDAPTRTILCAGGGSYEQAHITLTKGIHVGVGDGAAEEIAAQWDAISNTDGATIPEGSWSQGKRELEKAGHQVPSIGLDVG